MDKVTLKLKRHETFSIREGWIEKGLIKCSSNPQCFQKDKGTKELGLGSNMVKSLRYWLQACNLLKFGQKGADFSALGNLLLATDRYLENDFSWWMIHLYLVTNFEDAPVFNSFFNMPYSSFDKEFVLRYLKEYYTNNNYEIGSESSLDSDVSILLKSYYSDDDKNPEENTNCPLARLNLLDAYDKKTFKKISPSYDSLDFRVVYQAIIMCYENDIKNGKLSFNIEDLYDRENNPLRVFNISRSMLFAYLEEMKKNGFIDLIKTAGLNTVYIDKIMCLSDLFKSYYKKKVS